MTHRIKLNDSQVSAVLVVLSEAITEANTKSYKDADPDVRADYASRARVYLVVRRMLWDARQLRK